MAPSAEPLFAARLDGSFYYRFNTDGQLTFFSPSVTDVLGFDAEVCLNQFFDFLTDSPINHHVSETIASSIRGVRHEPFELEIAHLDGSIKRLEVSMVPIHNDAGILQSVESIAHDITRVHQTLAAYKRKSFLLDETEEIASMGTWDWNTRTNEVCWSPGFYKVLQVEEGQVSANADGYCQFLAPDDAKRLRTQIVKALKSCQVFECSHRLLLPNNEVKYIESRGKPLLDASGRVIRMIGTIDDITEQIEAQSQLEKAYRLVNSSVTEIYLIDSESYRFSFASDGACKNLGYDQMELTRMTPFDLCPVVPRVQFIEMMAPVVEQKQHQVVFEASFYRKDGSAYPVEIHLQLMDHKGSGQFIAIAMDISKRRQAQQQAQTQEALLHLVIDATPDLIFYKDNQGRYLGCNKAFAESLRLSTDTIIGSTDEQLQKVSEAMHFDKDDQQVLSSGEVSIYKEQIISSRGQLQVLETTKTPYYNSKGEVQGVMGISRDVTKETQINAELQQERNTFEHDAHYDGLTNLPNRALFMDRLNQSIHKAKRTHQCVAVFFIDIDRFKPINDNLGHDIGDAVLQEAALRLSTCVRKMDTIARLGGDEFTAIIEGIENPQSAAIIANKINIAMREPVVVNELELNLSASIGIAMYPDNGDCVDKLLKCADKAMYRVKQEGRNSFQFYTQDVTGATIERTLMETQLRAALANKEFCLFYQAQMSLDNDSITGLEAFVRWQHPTLGTILPAKFIPLAEDVGLIQAIDEWVLEQACTQMVKWKKRGLGDIRLAVNLSSAELLRNNLYEVIVSILARTGCEPQWLELEVTESCFSGDIENARVLLSKFSNLGINLVIDDFGTGYTSLMNLRKLPIDKLKIDQSFIHNVPQSSDDASIAQAVIGLGQSLGMQVVAEGVETDEQRQFLTEQRCQRAQGYLFSRPVSADMIEKKLSFIES